MTPRSPFDLRPPSGWLFLLRLLAWEHVVLGTLSLIGAALLVVAPPPEAPPLLLAPLYLMMGGALVVAGAGMLSYRAWGRTLALVLALIIGLFAVLPLVGGQPPGALAMAHTLVTVGLLTRPAIRRAFGL